MKFHVLTLFPEMIIRGLEPSIIGRAVEKQFISLNAVDIRDYTEDKHGKVDDYTYGGGAGMLIQAQPVFDAHRAVTGGRVVRTVYVTPQGIPFTQKHARELANEEELVFLCGHYEGIDERVLQEVVTDYFSIGDYVLTGGELPAMVMIDAIARLVPGVLGNDTSAEEESFHNDLLEYPQYSRPEVWHEKKVPQVLLSGNHKNITAWRREQSEARTRERRPDLYEKYQAKQKLIQQLSKDKRNNIHMMESLAAGRSEILYAKGEDVLLYDGDAKYCTLLAKDSESAERIAARIPQEAELIMTSQTFVNEALIGKNYKILCACDQYLYPQKVTLPVKHKDIRLLTQEHAEYVCEHYAGADYSEDDWAYVLNRIHANALFGAFVEGKLAGFAGIHQEGSCGILHVEEAYRGMGLALSLESYVINWQIARGRVPYGHVVSGNDASAKLQEKLGLYKASKTFYWLEKSTCI